MWKLTGPNICFVAEITLLALVQQMSPVAHAGTIRHDLLDAAYLIHGAQPEYESVGRLVLDFNGDVSTCSGTLISSAWVLSAGHCFKDVNDSSVELSNLDTSSRLTFFDFDNEDFNDEHPLAHIELHSQWNGRNVKDGVDFALVRLASLELSKTPAVRYRGSNELGALGTMVGFGTTGNGLTGYIADTSGTKRAGENRIDMLGNSFNTRWSNNLMIADFDSSTSSLNVMGSAMPEVLEYFQTPGDSGGGWFVDVGGPKLAGVYSFFREAGIRFGIGSPEGDYNEIMAASRVSLADLWIDSTIQNYADVMRWSNPSSGNFNNSSNWNGNILGAAVPGEVDTVLFDVPNTVTVSVPDDVTNNLLVVRNGTTTFDLNGHTYRLTSNDISGSVVVGGLLGDAAHVRVTDGNISSARGVIADTTSSNGEVTVSGTGARWDSSASLYVGDAGNGSLQVDSGASVSTTLGIIGRQSRSQGTLTVDGNASSFVSHGDLRIGESGTGTVNITNGAQVTSNTSFVGLNSRSNGRVILGGENSVWTSNGTLYISGTRNTIGGTASITVGLGSTLEANEGIFIGQNGELIFDGGYYTYRDFHELAGRITVTSNHTSVRFFGSIPLNLLGSPTIQTDAYTTIENDLIGTTFSKEGDDSLTLEGAFDYSQPTHVNAGTLVLEGPFTGAADMVVAPTGVLRISTNGTVQGALEVRGGLEIEGNAQVSSTTGVIGRTSGSVATATISQNANWTNSSNLVVGRSGSGTLNLLSNAVVTGLAGILARSTDSEGTVNLNGASASWRNLNNTVVGRLGVGLMSIEAGSVSNDTGIIGSLAGSDGTVIVDGASSSWNNSNDLIVGHSGAATLDISNRALVTSAVGYVGFSPGSGGNVSVDGAGSKWTSNDLYVGGNSSSAGGSGVLTASNGGLVKVSNTLKIWGSGTIDLNGGTIKARTFDRSSGNFNWNSGTIHFIASLNIGIGEPFGNDVTVGPGRILKVRNILTTLGTGILSLDEGTVIVDSFKAAHGGVLSGTGIINVVSGLSNAATISPGNPVGILSIGGDYTQTDIGVLQIDINGSGSGEHDTLAISDAANLDGDILVTLLGEFQPSLHDEFDILTASIINDLGLNFMLPTLDDELAFETDIVSVASGGEALRLRVIPEPAAAAMLAMVLLTLLRRCRRE